MTLSYGKTSPQDMLTKAERDLARLEAAESDQDDEAMSDAIFDFAVALTSLKDWLKEHSSSLYTPSHIEAVVAGSPALNAFRDIANAGKHRVIRKYVPHTMSALTSAMSSIQIIAVAGDMAKSHETPKLHYHIKIVRSDGSRHRAIDLGRDAIRVWREFMTSHGLLA